MGRNAGYIALWCGIANGAEDILLPERYDGDEQALINRIIENRKRGERSTTLSSMQRESVIPALWQSVLRLPQALRQELPFWATCSAAERLPAKGPCVCVHYGSQSGRAFGRRKEQPSGGIQKGRICGFRYPGSIKYEEGYLRRAV